MSYIVDRNGLTTFGQESLAQFEDVGINLFAALVHCSVLWLLFSRSALVFLHFHSLGLWLSLWLVLCLNVNKYSFRPGRSRGSLELPAFLSLSPARRSVCITNLCSLFLVVYGLTLSVFNLALNSLIA